MAAESTFRVSFHPSKNYVYVHLEGILDIDTILQASQHVTDCPEFASDMFRVWNFSRADLSELDFNRLRELSVKLLNFWRRYKSRKIGIVSEKDINLGSLNFFREVYDEDKGKVRVFNSMNEFETWLSLPCSAG